MKKILCSLLTGLSVASFATVGDIPAHKVAASITNDDINQDSYDHRFYTIIINKSAYSIDIYTKNSLYWDNWGWGDNEGGKKLTVPSNGIRTYTGGTTNMSPHVWSDMPRIQHEWWFDKGGTKWEQSYSEQWLAYADTSIGNITRLVAGNDWSSAYDFASFIYKSIFNSYLTGFVSPDQRTAFQNFAQGYYGSSQLPDNRTYQDFLTYDGQRARLKLRNNSAVIYTVNSTMTQMTAECYALPFNVEKDIHNPAMFRQGPNLCPNVKPINI
ncbi:MAG: hypothetical protein PHC75_10505 [Burkholderiales bacterium]|nr:hypothetical protein [Burkholderiales bacterium]